jgi:hypothetical protein
VRHLQTIHDICDISATYQQDEIKFMEQMDGIKHRFDTSLLNYLTFAIAEEEARIRFSSDRFLMCSLLFCSQPAYLQLVIRFTFLFFSLVLFLHFFISFFLSFIHSFFISFFHSFILSFFLSKLQNTQKTKTKTGAVAVILTPCLPLGCRSSG